MLIHTPCGSLEWSVQARSSSQSFVFLCNSLRIPQPTERTADTVFFERFLQESHYKFSVTNQMGEDLWEDPTNAGMRP